MSMNMDKVLRNRRLWRALTSLDRAEFVRLEAGLEMLLAAERLERRHDEQPRQRAYGAGGETGKLPASAAKLVFLLFYFKCYPLQEVMGLLFGMSQPQACEWIKKLTPPVNAVLGRELRLPARRPADLDTLLKEVPELRLLVLDGVERPVRRPKDKDDQKKNYSGKKKADHRKKNLLRRVMCSPARSGMLVYALGTRQTTVPAAYANSGKKKAHRKKNLLLSSEKRVVYLGKTTAARRRRTTCCSPAKSASCTWDQRVQAACTTKKLADESGLTYPPDALVVKDTGFQGYEPPGCDTLQPKKKPRGRELHPIQKTINQLISRVRVSVEHAIAGIKRCHIVSDTFRNRRSGFVDEVMLAASGLHNLRVVTRTA